LVVRKEASFTRFTDRLFGVFGDDAIGWDAAKALGHIASSDQILTKRHHAIIKVTVFLSNLEPQLDLLAIPDFACPEVCERHSPAYHCRRTGLEQYASFAQRQDE